MREADTITSEATAWPFTRQAKRRVVAGFARLTLQARWVEDWRMGSNFRPPAHEGCGRKAAACPADRMPTPWARKRLRSDPAAGVPDRAAVPIPESPRGAGYF